MALYKDGNPISGLNSIPRLTLAQYNALNVKPEFWVRTDAPESYKKLSADQVYYDSNNTVKDKLDELDDKELNKWTTNSSATATSGRNLYKIANGLLHIWLNIQLTDTLSAGDSLAIATKTAMFTAQQDKLFIVAGSSSIASTQTNRLWGYLAIPIEQ